MSAIGFFEEHWKDAQGRPAGGVTSGRGFVVSWQNGPLGRAENRRPPNGAFVEDVIAACVGRLQFYEESGFACEENKDAIAHLEVALERLRDRTRRREAAGTEGTHAR